MIIFILMKFTKKASNRHIYLGCKPVGLLNLQPIFNN